MLMARSVWGAVLSILWSCSPPRSDSTTDSAAMMAPLKSVDSLVFHWSPDSLVHDSVVYRGKTALGKRLRGPELVLEVEVRSLRRQPASIESEASNCNPPIYFRDLTKRRAVRWSDVAWQARSNEASCVGTGLLVELANDTVGVLERRTYPVRAIRGDSLAAGWYDMDIGAVVFTLDQNSKSRTDTIRVPAGRVWLP
jgi:hypothetical protein